MTLPHKILITAVIVLTLVIIGGGLRNTTDNPGKPEVPRGYVSVLELTRDGRRLSFGPFVGYYFKPISPDDLTRLEFVCFNERRFYASDADVNAKLYEGEARLVELPAVGVDIPRNARINPIFFNEAPDAWLATRPEPQEAFLHFHSCYDLRGAVRTGFWLQHNALAAFTYDMGGRVGPESSQYHHVEPGIDHQFDRIIEFDHGPAS